MAKTNESEKLKLNSLVWTLFFNIRLQNEIKARIEINQFEWHYLLAAYIFQEVNRYFCYHDLNKIIQKNYDYKIYSFDHHYSRSCIELCKKGYFIFFCTKPGKQHVLPMKYYTLNEKKLSELFSMVEEIIPRLAEEIKQCFIKENYKNYSVRKTKMLQFLNMLEFE